MNWNDKGRIITVVDKWFRAFKSDERAIAGNNIHTFPSQAKTIIKKELLGEILTKKDIEFMEFYGIKPEVD